jgi:Metallo-peptidase family M12B Reprolysin-like
MGPMSRLRRVSPLVVAVLAVAVSVASAAPRDELRPLRTRYLNADASAVRGTTRAGQTLPLHLFDDASFDAELVRASDDVSNGFVWRGRLRGVEGGWVLLVVSDDGAMAGVVSTPDRLFRIRYAGRGLHAIDEMDPLGLDSSVNDAVAPDGGPEDPADGGAAAERRSGEAAVDDEPVVVDVLFLYTKLASTMLLDDVDTGQKTAKKAIKSQVQLSIAIANQSLENSKVDAQFRLVGLKKISYEPLGDTAEDLRLLRTPDDGVLDKAQKLREKFGADLVSLVLEKVSPGVAGLGYQVPVTYGPAADFAYSVLSYEFLWYSTFAHEGGHNLGLAHDIENDAQGPQWRNTPEAVGYRDSKAGFYTVMSYRTGCDACRFKIPYYSNPKVKFQGAPTASSYLFQAPCGNGTTTGAKCGGKTGSRKANAAASLADTIGFYAGHRACKVKCGP